MATIPTPGSELRHARKTITFTGGAGAGAVGTVTVFTTTGAQLIHFFTGYVTTVIGTAGVGTVALGTAHLSTSFTNASDFDGYFADSWLYGSGNAYGVWKDLIEDYYNAGTVANSEDIILTIAGNNVTSGVIVFDIWYRPITDDGALAGDDIDEMVHIADVTRWLGTAAATPTVAGVPEVDLTHVAGTAATAAAGIPEVKVASIAANAVTAAAVATDAIDADALAADALTEIFTKILTTAMTESYGADGAAPTLAQAVFLIIAALTEFAISGTTLTAKKLDGVTTAATFTLNSATTPTSITRAT